MPLEEAVCFYIKDEPTQKQIIKLCDELKQKIEQIKKYPKKEIIPFPAELICDDGTISMGGEI